MHQKILHFSRDNFRTEDKLLLYGIRTDGALDSAKQIKALLGEPIDWEFILQKAMQHGVMPLLYQNLTKCPQAVPKSTLEKLRKFYCINARRNLVLSQELLKVLSIFRSHCISAVPFKGPSLAEALYGDISMRQFSDLDIFIKEQDVERARDVFLSRGYRPDPIRQLDYEAHFIRKDSGLVVDLHWAISSNIKNKYYTSFAIDLERLWERTKKKSFLESTISQFSREDMFIIGCHHTVKDFWKGNWPQLKLVCDVAKMIQVHAEMDWEWIIEQGRKFGNQRVIFLCFSLANDLAGTVLPEVVEEKISSDFRVKVLSEEANRMFFFEPAGRNPFLDKQRGFLRRDLFCISLKERFKDKIPYYLRMLEGYRINACRAVKNKEDRGLLLLPDSLSCLYYVFFVLYYALRPIWRTAKFGSRLFERGHAPKFGKNRGR